MKKSLFPLIFGIILAAFTAYFMLDTFVIERVFDVPTEEYDYALFGRNGQETETASGETGALASAQTSPDARTEETSPDAPAATPTESEKTPESAGVPAPETLGGDETPDESATPSPAPTTGETDGDAIAAPFTAQPVIGENSYTDEHVAIFLSEERFSDTTVHIADVYLSSAEYLKTAFAHGKYGRNVKATTSEIAKENGAIFAVNGDFYGARMWGYVLRNGQLYRSSSSGGEDLAIYPDGSFEIINERTVKASTLKEKNAWQVLSFGPALLIDGEVSVKRSEEVGQAMASNPRTAIGIVDKLHYIFIVSDGRVTESKGLSLYELAYYMKEKGAVTAYNLDGGGSSTMYFCGRIVNTVSSGKTNDERSISDIVYIG